MVKTEKNTDTVFRKLHGLKPCIFIEGRFSPPKLTMMINASSFHEASSGGEIFRKRCEYFSQDPAILFNVIFILVN
jgi:hypothetical protein